MDPIASSIYDAVCEAIDALQGAGLKYIKVDIPNNVLDQFKGMIYAGRPEIEIRYEIPGRNETSMHLIWDKA